jgi:hypothetical protein
MIAHVRTEAQADWVLVAAARQRQTQITSFEESAQADTRTGRMRY